MAARVRETFDIWTPISQGPSAMGFTLDNTLGVTSAPDGRSATPGNIGPLWQDSRAPPLNPPGVPSSYLLNLLCPPWYGFRRPLSFGLHSGFFNYVVHFTCLCSFTPQDQGHKRSHLIISKQEVSTGPHRSITSRVLICCSIATTSSKRCLVLLKKESQNLLPLPPITILLMSIRKFVYLSGG